MLFRSKVLLFFWIIVCAVILYALLQSISHTLNARSRLNDLESRNTEAEQRVQELEKKVAQADNPFAKERIIREELNMQKPGEVVLGLPTESDATVSALSVPSEERANVFMRAFSGLLSLLSSAASTISGLFQ